MLFTLFLLLPGISTADMLHILDSEEKQTTQNSAASASKNLDFQESYSVLPGNEWEFGFSFKDSSAKFNWIVDVTVESDPREAGHKHNNPLPAYYYPNWPNKKKVSRLDGITLRSPLLTQGQRFAIHIAPLKYSTRLVARGRYAQYFPDRTVNPTLTHTLYVRVPGLESMPRNDRAYKFPGESAAHPETHYGTPATITSLKDLAAKWNSTHPGSPLIEFIGISLAWGGALDHRSDWSAADSSHSFGIAADIGKRNYNLSERAALVGLMCSQNFSVYNSRENDGEQYHIVNKSELANLKKLGWPVSAPVRTEKLYTDCCAAKAGTENYMQCMEFGKK